MDIAVSFVGNLKLLKMKKYGHLAILGCLIIASCDTKKTEIKITITKKELMEAGAKTIENMQTAYKGEKTATAKYEAFSKKAEDEGFHNIALLYKAVSRAESIHAANHKVVIEDAGANVPIIIPDYKVKTTRENLSDDVKGEAYEATTMYPNFLNAAATANNQMAIVSLTYAMKTEVKHNIFFEQALKDINSKKLSSLPTKYFVCPACGDTYATNAPNHCDFSLTEREKFIVFQ